MTPDEGEASARGDLAKTPFAHLVLYIRKRGLSGTLVISRAGFDSKVLFRSGRAVAAKPLPRGTTLQDGLLELCDITQAEYAFFDRDLLEDVTGVTKGTLDTLAFVAEASRTRMTDAFIARTLARYQNAKLRLTPGADLRRLGLRGNDARCVERLASIPQLPDEFAASSGLTADASRRVLYLLLILGHLAIDKSATSTSSSGVQRLSPLPRLSNWPPQGASRPPDPSLPPLDFASSPPRDSNPVGRVRSATPPAPLRSSAVIATPRPSGTMPSVAPQRSTLRRSVPPPGVSQSGRAAAPLPPSRSVAPSGRSAAPASGAPSRSVPAPRPSPLPSASRPPPGSRPPLSQRPVSSLPAWQQLAVRPGPNRTPLPEPIVIPSAAPPPFEMLDDEGKLRRAEQLAEHRNFEEATRIADALVARHPSNADYLTLRASLCYQTFVGNEPPKLLADLLERALRLNERHPRALYLKGLLLKRLGKTADAARYFQAAVSADPQFLAAQRELRLANMRR